MDNCDFCPSGTTCNSHINQCCPIQEPASDVVYNVLLLCPSTNLLVSNVLRNSSRWLSLDRSLLSRMCSKPRMLPRGLLHFELSCRTGIESRNSQCRICFFSNPLVSATLDQPVGDNATRETLAVRRRYDSQHVPTDSWPCRGVPSRW